MTAIRVAVMGPAAVLLSLAGSVVLAQSSELPVVRRDADKPPSTIPMVSPSGVQHRARVFYSNGQLEIIANNSNLDQILRDIALQTGIKITGSVADQPVYGRYGPAAPDKILTSLLDGTNSNMLLTAATSDVPAELILTPRQGSPTPSVSAPVTTAQVTPQTAQPNGVISSPSAQRSVDPSVTSGLSTQSTGASTPAPAGGDRTQQQIFEHIKQLQELQHAPH